jgi:hypothetical protein
VRQLVLATLMVFGGLLAVVGSWLLLRSGESWKPVALVGVVLVVRGVWDWREIDGWFALAAVVCGVTAFIGLMALHNAESAELAVPSYLDPSPADRVDSLRLRGRIFVGIGATALVFALHRLRIAVRAARANIPRADVVR